MDIKNTLYESEKKIKEIQKNADAQIKELRKAVLADSVKLFSEIGWTSWAEQELMGDEQFSRVSKAVDDKMKLVSIDRLLKVGQVESSAVYDVSESGCTCKDFSMRKLPCKHMYFLALQLAADRPIAADDKDEAHDQQVNESSGMLGCCSQYRECSMAGHCLKPDDYSRMCAYRKNLESGNVFYSKKSIYFSQEKYDYISEYHHSLNESEKRVFESLIIHFKQDKIGVRYCLCLYDQAVFNVLSGFKGFKIMPPTALVDYLFDRELIMVGKAKNLHAKYSKQPAAGILPYPPALPQDADSKEKKAREEEVKQIKKINLKTWRQIFLNDADLLQVLSHTFIFFEICDYDFELMEYCLDDSASFAKKSPELTIYDSKANDFKEYIDRLAPKSQKTSSQNDTAVDDEDDDE